MLGQKGPVPLLMIFLKRFRSLTIDLDKEATRIDYLIEPKKSLRVKVDINTCMPVETKCTNRGKDHLCLLLLLALDLIMLQER